MVVKNDDTDGAQRPGGHKTLKGWPRVDLVALARTRRAPQEDDAEVEATRVEAAPQHPDDADDIPELPSALLELADDGVYGDAPELPPAPEPPTAPEPPAAPELVEETLDASSTKNRLRIRAGAFALELEGDEAFINAVYDSVRHDLIAKMTASTQEVAAPAAPAAPARSERVNPGASREDAVRVRGNGYVWVYVCHELYNKVHVVPRDLLAVSPLSGVVDMRQLSRIYVNRARIAELEGLIGTGKTLWSELTDEGRRRLRRGGL